MLYQLDASSLLGGEAHAAGAGGGGAGGQPVLPGPELRGQVTFGGPGRTSGAEPEKSLYDGLSLWSRSPWSTREGGLVFSRGQMRPPGEGQDMGRMGRRRLGGPGEQGTPGLSKGRVWRWAGGVGSPERASSQLTGMGILDTAAMGGTHRGCTGVALGGW